MKKHLFFTVFSTAILLAACTQQTVETEPKEENVLNIEGTGSLEEPLTQEPSTLEQYLNEEWAISFQYDAETYEPYFLESMVDGSVGSVYLLREDGAKAIWIRHIEDPKVTSVDFQTYLDFLYENNEGSYVFDTYHGASKVLRFSGYDSYVDWTGSVVLDQPSDIYVVEHKDNRFIILIPFLGNEVFDSISFL